MNVKLKNIEEVIEHFSLQVARSIFAGNDVEARKIEQKYEEVSGLPSDTMYMSEGERKQYVELFG